MFKFINIFLIALFLTACSPAKNSRPMIVAANLWIGYSPLYYAEEKGWLRENNIKLVRTTSLAESLKAFKNGHIDMFAGTQYEFEEAKKLQKTLKTLILLDRSNGGDIILSNRSIDELKNEKFTAYLEMQSINKLFLQEFIRLNSINADKIKLINKTPDSSSKLIMKKEPIVIVTYNPYEIQLKKRGYRVAASTNDKNYLIFDALFTSTNTQELFSQEIDKLNSIVSKSLDVLSKDPKEYYSKINKYFQYVNYDEFISSIDSIEWIYKDRSQKLLTQLNESGIDNSHIMQPGLKGK